MIRRVSTSFALPPSTGSMNHLAGNLKSIINKQHSESIKAKFKGNVSRKMYEVGNVNKATTVKAWSGPKQLQNVQSKTELR